MTTSRPSRLLTLLFALASLVLIGYQSAKIESLTRFNVVLAARNVALGHDRQALAAAYTHNTLVGRQLQRQLALTAQQRDAALIHLRVAQLIPVHP